MKGRHQDSCLLCIIILVIHHPFWTKVVHPSSVISPTLFFVTFCAFCINAWVWSMQISIFAYYPLAISHTLLASSNHPCLPPNLFSFPPLSTSVNFYLLALICPWTSPITTSTSPSWGWNCACFTMAFSKIALHSCIFPSYAWMLQNRLIFSSKTCLNFVPNSSTMVVATT